MPDRPITPAVWLLLDEGYFQTHAQEIAWMLRRDHGIEDTPAATARLAAEAMAMIRAVLLERGHPELANLTTGRMLEGIRRAHA